jgi:phage-related protein
MGITLAARYIVLTRRMLAIGPNLGEPHTKAMGSGLFELRLKGAEGIARVFYCTLVGKRVVMLQCFVKKTQRTPKRELEVAQRMGTLAPSVARLERSLATGKHLPSIATVRKYAKACGKELILQVA